MSTLNDKRTQHTRLLASLDLLIREDHTPSLDTISSAERTQQLRNQIKVLEQEIHAAPLEISEVIELTSDDYRGLQFIVKEIHHSNTGPQIALRHPSGPDFRLFSRFEIDNLGFKRSGKWSGYGSIPPVCATVLVVINALGPATVVAHEILEGWLGLRVRYHKPPAWWHRQNEDPNRCGLVFGSEIRW